MKTKILIYTLLFLHYFLGDYCSIQAQNETIAPRPRLGIALAGGGAKGLAHIGVLQVLEENGIMPDYITGTSMGSIVGGLYAIGYTPQEMIDLTTQMEWDYYFKDSYPRTYLPIEERNKADRYQLSFAIENGALVLPKGLIAGRKILNFLGGITASAHTIYNFDQFYIPFRCVATDLETGEAYVFKKGSLRHAIRASMSIPSAFDPLLIDGHLLVDGMVARNFPVQDAFEMGADIVIGVDVGAPLYKTEELNSVLKVMEQMSGYRMVESTLHQRSLTSLIIDPDLTGYSSLSYDATDTLIERGRQAATKALPEIKKQLDEMGWVATPKVKRPPLRKDSFLIRSIEFNGDNSRTKQTLEQLLSVKTPSVLTIKELSEWTGLLYSSGFFSMVDYQIAHSEEGDYKLIFTVEGTPDYHVKLSFNYDTDFNAGLLLNFTARNKLVNGSLFSTDIRVSQYPGVWMDYMIYTRSQPSFGILFNAGAQIIPGDIYKNEELFDEFTFHQYQLGLHLQASLSRQWHIKGGIIGEQFSENPRFFTLNEQESQLKQWSVNAQFFRDTYDRSYFPKDGSMTQLWAQYSLAGRAENAEIGENNFNTDGNIHLGLKLHKAFSLSPKWWFDFSLGGAWSQTKNDHLLQRFYIGRSVPENFRFFEVYGYQQTELMPTAFAFSRLQLRTEIKENYFVALGYNYGKWSTDPTSKKIIAGEINGLGLELGAITPLGPLRFTSEYNLNYKRFNFSFFAGYRF